jgi:hypothetical protein
MAELLRQEALQHLSSPARAARADTTVAPAARASSHPPLPLSRGTRHNFQSLSETFPNTLASPRRMM